MDSTVNGKYESVFFDNYINHVVTYFSNQMHNFMQSNGFDHLKNDIDALEFFDSVTPDGSEFKNWRETIDKDDLIIAENKVIRLYDDVRLYQNALIHKHGCFDLTELLHHLRVLTFIRTTG